MKKRLFSLLLAILTVVTASAAFRWGPTVGINGSTFSWKQDLVNTRHAVGFSAGVTGELMIPGIGFGIGTGLNYQMNGANVNFGERKVWSSLGFGDCNVRIHTVQLPLNLRFKWTRMEGLEQYLAPLVFGGPVFTFNCGGSNSKMLDIPFGTIDLQVGAGAEIFRNWQLYGGYYWGVSYQARTKLLDNFSARPQGWFIGASWLF